jgi:hypothetical protein
VRELGCTSWAERRKENGSGPRGKGAGPRGRRGAGQAGLEARVAFLFPFPFLFQTNSNLFDFKSNLNSSPTHSTK